MERTHAKGSRGRSPSLFLRNHPPGNGHAANGAALTHCERCVLQMVAESLTTKQIAERMCMSPKTVEHHRASLMKKAGVRDVAGLTRYAVRHGLVPAA